MKVLPIYLLGMLLILYFFSCNAHPSEVTTDKLLKSDTTKKDSVQRDIGLFFRSEEWKKYRTGLESAMNMYPIYNGVEGWEIRLRIDRPYRAGDSTQLFIFKNEAGKISGSYYNYLISHRMTWDTAKTVGGIFKSIVPRSGWKSFMDSISALDIYVLPDCTELPKYLISTDNFGVRVEIGKPNYYRIYTYVEYEKNALTHVEARKMIKILELLEREFNIKVLYYPGPW